MKRTYAWFLLPLVAIASGSTLFQVSAHDSREHFTAGEPGDPKKPSRLVKVTMLEEGTQMLFEPAVVEVRLGEQIRFFIYNEGMWNHEFILATKTDNRKHALLMKKFPNMEHDEPNGKRLSPFSAAEILWKFTKRGEFEYGCLIPGHLEAGMHGNVLVK